MENGTDVLFIGFDSAEPTLIDELCRAGRLPNLEALGKDHVSGPVAPPPGLGNDGIWRSFGTCVSPATHGHYYIRPFDPVSYRCIDRPPPADAPRPFWEHISDAGGRVAVIDVPLAPLPERLNGILLAEWLASNAYIRPWLGLPYSGDGHEAGRLPFAYPAGLAQAVAAGYGLDTIGQRDQHGFGAKDYLERRDALIDSVERKARLCADLLERERWDVMMVVFSESHDVGHAMWHLHDQGHRRHDADWVRRHGDPVADVYVAIDAAIGRLIACCPDRATVCVMTETGMTADNSGNFILDDVLQRLEFGAAPPRSRGDALRSVYHLLPLALRQGIRDRFTRGVNSAADALSTGGRRGRRFFAVDHNEISGAIRFNVIDREAEGRVAPGRELDEVSAELTEDLLALRNADTGTPVVSEVVRSSEVYQGRHAEALPDLFVIWNREVPLDGVVSPKFGEYRREYQCMRTGDHVPLGRFYARGPGAGHAILNPPVSVLDFGPTIASILGIELPGPVEGTPIPQLAARP